MDNLRHSNLVQTVDQQKRVIEVLKSKLRDLFVAHQGLLKEKEALETSLKALEGTNLGKNVEDVKTTRESPDIAVDSSAAVAREDEGTVEELKQRLASLLNSLSTLSAEKSRMEVSFQLDKKQLRIEKENAEQNCAELQINVNKLEQDVEGYKSRLISERHERDRERNDHGVMLKELQQLLAAEKQNKLTLEALVDEMRQNLSSNENALVHNFDKYETKMAGYKRDLAQTKQKLETSERKAMEATAALQKTKDELINIQIAHQNEIQKEVENSQEAEERSKKLSAAQEERVVVLETRLAELSEIVGSYDRVKQKDQTEIQKLKEQIALLDVRCVGPLAPEKEEDKSEDVDQIIKKMLELKTQLQSASEKGRKRVNLVSLLSGSVSESLSIHATCNDEYNKLKKDFETLKNLKSQRSSNTQETPQKELTSLQNQVKSLQERVRIISDHSREMEKDYQIQVDHLKKTMKTEKSRFKETLTASEADYRGRLCLLEQQLQKQRERSLALLEEKEQEIHSLQNTFQMFLPDYRRNSESQEDEREVNVSGLGQVQEGPHMLHYANELARRDVEIANLRKNKHKVEIALRELQKAAVSDTEKHRDERQALREEIARLKRCQTREGANLEYLKNVVLSFLLSGDASSKRHMCNAIAAVLKFSEAELEKVSQHSRNSWWNRTSSYL